MKTEELRHRFIQHYGSSTYPVHLFFSPSRVNLIGEHTDYNGGYVLPIAMQMGTYLAVRLSDEPFIKFSSENDQFSINVPLANIEKKIDNQWVNYPLGVINEFARRGVELNGAECLYAGEIPYGAGLSTSASMELVTAIAINDMIYNRHLDIHEMIKISQKAENRFVGVQCGIMDQFAVGISKPGHALFLNCQRLEYEHVPVDFEKYKFIVAYTNKQRGLTESKYNERRFECQEALHYLNQVKPVINLSEIEWNEFQKIQDVIPEDKLRRRAAHVISENSRVKAAVKALKDKQPLVFGQLMNESHDSLKQDYQVSGYELDVIVEEARKLPSVSGSRMTGAGFGGSTVSLVLSEAIDEFKEKTGTNYHKKTGLKADFYEVEISGSARKIMS